MTFSGGRTQTDFSLEERPMKQEIIRKLSAAVAMSLVVGVSGRICTDNCHALLWQYALFVKIQDILYI